jgi:hypothetical protein
MSLSEAPKLKTQANFQTAHIQARRFERIVSSGECLEEELFTPKH